MLFTKDYAFVRRSVSWWKWAHVDEDIPSLSVHCLLQNYFKAVIPYLVILWCVTANLWNVGRIQWSDCEWWIGEGVGRRDCDVCFYIYWRFREGAERNHKPVSRSSFSPIGIFPVRLPYAWQALTTPFRSMVMNIWQDYQTVACLPRGNMGLLSTGSAV
jgi:hypothetical protein